MKKFNAFSCFALIFLSACTAKGPATFGTDLDPSSVNPGMTRSEVQSRLGSPTRSESIGSSSDGTAREVSVYAYQAPTNDGRFIFKELTVVYSGDVVNSKSFRERILLKAEKEVRVSNNTVELK
jgi:hypothetical protein